jgi:Carbohydrate-binding family 9
LNNLPSILLSKSGEEFSIDPLFFNATDGNQVDFETHVKLSLEGSNLIVKFECFDNPFTKKNTYTKDNDELYNQEVFEIFVSAGLNDPENYYELEINPNNAIWIGKMYNPTLGVENVQIQKMFTDDETSIRHTVQIGQNSYSGKLSIPLNSISPENTTDFRINFYRIRSFKDNKNSNWLCDANNCNFVCWSSTLSGDQPAFHRPKRFGFLKII